MRKASLLVYLLVGLILLLVRLYPSVNSSKTSQTQLPGSTYLVTRVIDGDTIEIEGGVKVRYIGIDTPETVDPRRAVQCFGKEAAKVNKDLVLGKRVALTKGVSDNDRYGRLLRYVYKDNIFVNDYLVREGFAYAKSYPPDVKYQDQFRDSQKKAVAENKGLWGSCPAR